MLQDDIRCPYGFHWVTDPHIKKVIDLFLLNLPFPTSATYGINCVAGLPSEASGVRTLATVIWPKSAF